MTHSNRDLVVGERDRSRSRVGYYLLTAQIPESQLADAVGPQGLPRIYAYVLGGLSLVLIARALRASSPEPTSSTRSGRLQPARPVRLKTDTRPGKLQSPRPEPKAQRALPGPPRLRRHHHRRGLHRRGPVAGLHRVARGTDCGHDVLPGRRDEPPRRHRLPSQAPCCSGCCSSPFWASSIRLDSGHRSSDTDARSAVLHMDRARRLRRRRMGHLGRRPAGHLAVDHDGAAAAAHVWDGSHRGNRDAGVHVRWSGVRRIDSRHPDSHAGDKCGCGDCRRRVRDEAAGESRRGARHLPVLRIRRRPFRPHRAGHAGRAALERGAGVHTASLLRAWGARSQRDRIALARVADQGADGRRARTHDLDDWHRPGHRAQSLYLRESRAALGYSADSRHGGALRNWRDAGADRRGWPAGGSGAPSHPLSWACDVAAYRVAAGDRLGHRDVRRGDARRRWRRFLVPRLQRGAALVASKGRVRDRVPRKASRRRKPRTTPSPALLSCRC